MFRGHYDNWILSRIAGIDKYIGLPYFNGKKLLELGCGHAHVGNLFHEAGADVTSSDARTEHIEVVNKIYPHLKTIVLDGDKDIIPDTYDVIVQWGLLYHLEEIENHLKMVSQKCKILLLETEVSDSSDVSLFVSVQEGGYDQAFNSKGIRPSQTNVEEKLTRNGFKFRVIKDSILNSDFHIYDWDEQNTGRYPSGLRRFWICWKDIESPFLPTL